MCQREIVERRREEEHDQWFNQAWPMTEVTQTWKEKRLAREECSSDNDDNHNEQGKIRQTEDEACNDTSDWMGTSEMKINMVCS
jgi:hypothetical protein